MGRNGGWQAGAETGENGERRGGGWPAVWYRGNPMEEKKKSPKVLSQHCLAWAKEKDAAFIKRCQDHGLVDITAELNELALLPFQDQQESDSIFATLFTTQRGESFIRLDRLSARGNGCLGGKCTKLVNFL